MANFTIATEAIIGDDHQLTIRLPDNVPTGTHRVTVVVDTQHINAETKQRDLPWHGLIFEGMNWIEGEKLTRDEFYDYPDV